MKRPRRDEHKRTNDKKPARPERRDPREREPERTRDNAVYGVLPVLEALRANTRRIDRILIADGAREQRLSEVIALARKNGVTVIQSPRESLLKIVGREANTQGVVAISAPVDYASADEVIDGAAEPALFVILDGVEDPRNLGAVLRTAECVGSDGIFIPERRAVGLNETVAKSSAGAIEYVKVAKVANINRLIEQLKEKNIWVVGTSGDAELEYSDWDWSRPSAIVMGAEGTGLHRLVAENCDVLVKIPMYGKIDSLNVSVAAGVILFEAQRQRRSLRD